MVKFVCLIQLREKDEQLENKVDELQQLLDTERQNWLSEMSQMQDDR